MASDDLKRWREEMLLREQQFESPLPDIGQGPRAPLPSGEAMEQAMWKPHTPSMEELQQMQQAYDRTACGGFQPPFGVMQVNCLDAQSIINVQRLVAEREEFRQSAVDWCEEAQSATKWRNRLIWGCALLCGMAGALTWMVLGSR
jgi:hypothetical protein